MKKQNAAIWCALLLIALPIAVLLLVPSPSARIVDVVQPLMESEEIDYWNPDIFFLTKYGLTAAVSALCGLALTLLCSRKRLPLDTRAAICTDEAEGAASAGRGDARRAAGAVRSAPCGGFHGAGLQQTDGRYLLVLPAFPE